MPPRAATLAAFLIATSAALAVETPAEVPVPPGAELEFHGNVLFNEYVYRSLLQLPATSKADLATARVVAKRLARFLHDAGYVLATVRARAIGGRIHIDIEEGQLDKIIFLGEGTFETLRLKFELSLPFNVFNRPMLETQLKRIAARYQLQDFAYELVPVDDPSTALPQLDELEALQTLPFVKPGHPYELRIFVQPTVFGTGFSPDLYVGGADGLGIGAHYVGKNLFVDNDRFALRARVAASTRAHLDTQESRPVLSRTRADARWFSPPLIGDSFRPTFGGGIELLSRQRGDLHLDNFNQTTLEVNLGVEHVLSPTLRVGFGAGIERRILFDLESIGVVSPQVSAAPLAQTRFYGQGIVRVSFNVDEIRRDRRHSLDTDVRVYGPSASNRPASLRLLAGYQKVWTFGWHELWLNARGTLLTGDVLFADEESIGEHLKGPFGGAVFARKLASLGLEYRYSLLRDIFKIGLFHDAVAYGDIDRSTVELHEQLRGANATGLGLHALVLDEFAIDVWYGFGWTTDGRNDHGLSIAIRQAF